MDLDPAAVALAEAVLHDTPRGILEAVQGGDEREPGAAEVRGALAARGARRACLGTLPRHNQ